MNPITRIFRYLQALLNGKLDEWEDPELIINGALKDMRENQVKNRELAVQAITQKNNLQAVVDKEERLVAELEKKATLALTSGNRELAKQFLKEKTLHESTLGSMRTNLASATEASEKVKIAIKQEEERFRVRTAEALAMKANMKQAQIQIKINQALDSFSFSDNEHSWSSVQDKITSMQSEASARAEITSGGIDARIREMEVSQMDIQADEALAQLEAKIAAGGVNTNRYTSGTTQQVQTVGGGGAPLNGNGSGGGTATAPESDLDRQLRELEDRLKNK